MEVIEEKTIEERITELGVDLNDQVPSFVLCYADNNEMRKLVDQGVFHLQQRQKQAELDALQQREMLALAASRKEALRKQQEQEEEEKAEQEHQESPNDKKEDKPDKSGAQKEKKQEKQ